MAITVTTILAGTYTFIADVVASADGDTVTGAIAHGLGVAPSDVTLCPLLQAAAEAAAWALTTRDATNIELTKATTAGSGNASASVRVVARVPHSITS